MSSETGCSKDACSPCSLAHASAICSPSRTCAVDLCENGWGDCNGEPADGCEAELARDAANCGACGNACSAPKLCRKGACVDDQSVAGWLESKRAGWCLEAYNQLINLCGDVEFCFDQRVMREYPEGLAVDVGFEWDGAAPAVLVGFGGDCDGMSLTIEIDPDGTLVGGGFNAGGIQVKVAPGKHLVSYQVSPTATALFVDGERVGEGGPPAVSVALLDRCGPGLVLGQRISYWWEAAQHMKWARFAPFYVQLREGGPDARAYSVARATGGGPGTVFLFDAAGVDGARWNASVGGLVAVAKNSLSGMPEIDAGASGPLPVWKPLADCSLGGN